MKVFAILLSLVYYCSAYSQFTYTRDVKDSNYTIYPYNMIITKSDNCILATVSPSYTASPGIYITKLNARGSLVWSKNYTFFKAFLSDAQKIYDADNEGFFCATRTDGIAFGGDLLFKADSNGNILWAKRIKPTTTGHLMSPCGVVYATDKSIYVINYIFATGLLIQKLNSVGEAVWNRYLQTDSTNSLTLFAYATATADNGLVISTTSSKNLQDKYYNHIFKISKDGTPEYEYTTNQASDDYIYAWAAKAANNGTLNILFSQYGFYRYSTLNLSTGVAETYNAGQSVFDIQSFLRSNKVNIFKGVSFPYVGFNGFLFENAFTQNWNLIQTMLYNFSGRKTRPRIQRYDSLGRICPNYQIQDTQRVNDQVSFRFTKSFFHFSVSPVKLSITDTVVAVENIDTITKICAGVPPILKHSFITSNATNSADAIQVFPNPTSTQINISMNSAASITNIELSDIHGMIIKIEPEKIIKQNNTIKINVSSLSSGLYFLKITTPFKIINRKIIKQ